jgi:hypothetical protein
MEAINNDQHFIIMGGKDQMQQLNKHKQLNSIEFELIRTFNPITGRTEHKITNVKRNYK